MSLFDCNTPEFFWCYQVHVRDDELQSAVQRSLHILGFERSYNSIEDILLNVLGEKQFGPEHWCLGSVKHAYYHFKPFIPRPLTKQLRRLFNFRAQKEFLLNWPIEDRYVQFQYEVMKNILMLLGKDVVSFRNFWPKKESFALVLTHDVETAKGQDFVREIADLEESLGFCSSFNFVPERYSLNRDLMTELVERGFEIGVHGLKHDGKLFFSYDHFKRRVARINLYLREWNAVGFRAPLTMRNPEWLQHLEIDYDSSFFDTDPFEPIPGGTMSIWPFKLGHFIELPYTLVQDYTLIDVLGETSPSIWLDKVEFIKKYHGMALLNTHPDYLKKPKYLRVYSDFLETMHSQGEYWHVLPKDVASWWRSRSNPTHMDYPPAENQGEIRLMGNNIEIN